MCKQQEDVWRHALSYQAKTMLIMLSDIPQGLLCWYIPLNIPYNQRGSGAIVEYLGIIKQSSKEGVLYNADADIPIRIRMRYLCVKLDQETWLCRTKSEIKWNIWRNKCSHNLGDTRNIQEKSINVCDQEREVEDKWSSAYKNNHSYV